jgi:hexosaminidase
MIDSLNRYERLSGGKYLSSKTKINTSNPVISSFIKTAGDARVDHYGSVEFIGDIPQSVIRLVEDAFGTVYQENPEGYIILLHDDITIYSHGLRGFIYGACDLMRMASNGFIKQGVVYNVPLAEFRSLKVYLPPEENIGFFKEVIDLCCQYRCNTLIIEVGGAMEYKNHPEINEGWVAYCAEMHEYSGKTTVIQEQTFPWGKNSIHCENGGGKFLSQAQVRDIVEYCRARGIDAIPEMPTLSHCDYLLTRHHEFAERQADPYADTYCPSAPGVYEYVFDVLDEVIDVFRPTAMHIGHDEFYSVGICDKCRGKSAVDLYTDDIIKIHGHLASKGVRTIIWSEKLLNSITKGGRPVGGAEKPFYFKGEKQFTIPATYPAIERVPKDILCMHWYWSIMEAWDEEFLRRGFYMFFGNFHSLAMPNAAKRLAAGAKGGGPSNWSYATLPYLQENGALLSLAYAALLFWIDGMADDRYQEGLRFCFDDLFRLCYGDVLKQPHIEILHTTTHHRPYMSHADGVFIDYDADTIGKYNVKFDDGTNFEIPVVYGQNITNRDRVWTRGFAGKTGGADMGGDDDSDDYESYVYDTLLSSVAYSTLPVQIGAETWFRLPVENPCPQKKIIDVCNVEKPGMEGKLLVKDIKIIG